MNKNEDIRKMMEWVREDAKKRMGEVDEKSAYSVTIRFTDGSEVTSDLPTALGRNLFNTYEGQGFFTNPKNFENPDTIASISIKRNTEKTINYLWRA